MERQTKKKSDHKYFSLLHINRYIFVIIIKILKNNIVKTLYLGLLYQSVGSGVAFQKKPLAKSPLPGFSCKH